MDPKMDEWEMKIRASFQKQKQLHKNLYKKGQLNSVKGKRLSAIPENKNTDAMNENDIGRFMRNGRLSQSEARSLTRTIKALKARRNLTRRRPLKHRARSATV
jgi:hypothetical protein